MIAMHLRRMGTLAACGLAALIPGVALAKKHSAKLPLLDPATGEIAGQNGQH